MKLQDKHVGNYRGIVIQNNDPLYSGRVKVFVPSVNANILEGWINNFTNDETINHLGSNVNGFSNEIIIKLKKILPWSGTCMPLFGMGSAGFYMSPNNHSFLSSDSNQSQQQKRNLEQCENPEMQKNFDLTGSSKSSILEPAVNGKLVNVQATGYGFPSDLYRDTNSLNGIGNRTNQLYSNRSIALQAETAQALGVGLKDGSKVKVTFPDGKTGIYTVDDTIPSDYNQHRIDFYFNSDEDYRNWPYDHSNLTIEKYTGDIPASSEEPKSDIITPPNYVTKDSCNQGSGGIGALFNNKMDFLNYTGNKGMDSSTKTAYPNTTYRNPNDYRGANTQIADLTLHNRPINHSNNYKGMISIPAVGSHVWVFFEEGDPNLPVVFGYHANQEAHSSIHGVTKVKDDQYFK